MPNIVIPYTISGNYTYNSDKMAVSGGLATLLEDLSDVYARWHLNESTGATVIDTSGNSRDGTPANSPASIAGKLNNALSFNGSNQYVNCSDIANFERTQAFSVECWFKTSSALAMTFMSRMQLSPSRGWLFFMQAGGEVQLVLRNATSSNEIVIGTNDTFNDNLWHHCVITYDGSSSASGITIYIDGSPVATTASTDKLSATMINTGNCSIAARDNSSLFFSGIIDEARIYDRELTGSEVTFEYNSNAGREGWYLYDDDPSIFKTTPDTINPSAWINFVETLGGGNETTWRYKLTRDDYVTLEYWDGGAWVTAGANDWNTAATIHSNIAAYPVGSADFGVVAYAVSDSTQEMELDNLSIGYTVGISPTVYAGTDKATKDNTTIKPFSDCTFSDADGTVDHAFYKVIGEVPAYTEILIGGYSTLLEAVQDFDYTFNNTGTINLWLKVEDNEALTAEDDLDVVVSQYSVTFNVRDAITTQHLTGVSFTPGDGSGVQTEDSPFTWDYNHGSFEIIIEKPSYVPVAEQIDSYPDHTENYSLGKALSQSDIALIADAVWDEAIVDHTTVTTFGGKNQKVVPSETINDYKADVSELATEIKIDTVITNQSALEILIKRILGLTQENFRVKDQTFNASKQLLTATIRIYSNATDCDNDVDPLEEYSLTATYDGLGRNTLYKVTKN